MRYITAYNNSKILYYYVTAIKTAIQSNCHFSTTLSRLLVTFIILYA